MNHENHAVCAAHGALASCHAPDAPSPKPDTPTIADTPTQVSDDSALVRHHIAGLFCLLALFFTCIAGAAYLTSQRVSSRPDGNTVFVFGSDGKGLTKPTIQGTNCGVRTIDKAWLVINFRAITLPAEARPNVSCASLAAKDELHR